MKLPATDFMKGLFERFCDLVNRLPAEGAFEAVAMQRQIIEDDLASERTVGLAEEISLLNFCRFIQAVATGGKTLAGFLPPSEHLRRYREIVERLVNEGQLPVNAPTELENTFSCRPKTWPLRQFKREKNARR